MKKITLAAVLALTALSFNASASEFDDIENEIISWCGDATKVVGYDANNQVALKYDCAARGEQCRQYQIVRFNRILHIASCAAK